jgi:acyl-CoA thioesterase YciA|tara:strand:- start:7 stop:423 length:417 start_codon:yes stop_codon:yes gene_type:complete
MKLISTHLCLAKDLGIHNNLFGGVMLGWLDEAGASLASQIINTPRVVTVKLDKVEFTMPVKTGNLIKIYGEVKEFGNTSITLHLEAKKESPYTGRKKTVCSTNIKFVRIDDDGDPVPISERCKAAYREKIKALQTNNS